MLSEAEREKMRETALHKLFVKVEHHALTGTTNALVPFVDEKFHLRRGSQGWQ
jgi:hypothetical protein